VLSIPASSERANQLIAAQWPVLQKETVSGASVWPVDWAISLARAASTKLPSSSNQTS
jgi:hypothetical protein